ncbi:GNAT family N-acetyltransferase [Priestia endophytica]|uniref:GNAT family N-acetyltransferase n=1 Tax=Priestia endophytica TaxID=135735 RepID=A0AAX1QA26_9BACI|nr:GNAT family N-acetyltransferase [Priestia endophytica]RAS76670.1 GNAT family N-acetyltransferase [Priestia endophytica]
MNTVSSYIRPIDFLDVEKFMPLVKSYIVDFYKCPIPFDEELFNHITSLIKEPVLGKQFVIEQEDEFVGFATLYFTFSTTKVSKIAILNDLFIKGGHRGKGLGEELFEFALNYSKKHDYAVMSWKTASDNEQAQSLYNKKGGTITNDHWINYEIKL